MKSMPQLRVRTGYSFQVAYGRIEPIIEKLKEDGCDFAAMVDSGTWGNVSWEKANKESSIVPGYGMEVSIVRRDEDGDPVGFKPLAWMLAQDTRKFYTATSMAVQRRGLTASEFGALQGVIRFPGGALDVLPLDAYDYIDINPSSFTLARRGVLLARKTGKPIVITGYNDMPLIEDENYAYAWKVRDSVGIRHIANEEELWFSFMGHIMTIDEFKEGIANAHKIADSLRGITLPKANMISLEGDFVGLCRAGQESRIARGHIKEWTDEYEARLKFEIDVILSKEFSSYFLAVSDLVKYAKKIMTVGPGRGSAAGSLVCYLMGITEVDPIPFGLLFERFLSSDRAEAPDIDLDFPDTKRHLVFEYLQDKYSVEKVAKIGNVNQLQPRSVMAQVGKKFNLPAAGSFPVINALIEHAAGDARYGKSLEDTFANTSPGRHYAAENADAARCMSVLELHPSHSGVHAAGVIVCNEPVTEYCTVNSEGVAQIDKRDAEYLNLLKIDVLGLRTLGIIEDSGSLSNDELYSLPLDDKSVLDLLNQDKVTGIFQIEGAAARGITRQINVDSFSKIDNITSLARPGPMSSGMVQKYVDRAAGKDAVSYDFAALEPILKDTFGVVIYQEQIMQIVREIGGFDWAKVSKVRRLMSKSSGAEALEKFLPEFIEGASRLSVSESAATKLWREMAKFGSYAFNRAHSASYSVVTYWTLYLKRYHTLEFTAACLREAKDDVQTIAILREMEKEGVSYTPIDPDYSTMNWRVADGRLIGGIMNAIGFGSVTAMRYIQKRDAGLLTDADKAKLGKRGIRFQSLREAHSRWGDYYSNPSLIGVTSGNPIVDIKTVEDKDNCLIIGKLVSKKMGDQNEPERVRNRGGKAIKGPSEFVDLFLVDDSVDSPVRFRIKEDKFPTLGMNVAMPAKKDSWFLVSAWKLPNIEMMMVKNIKRIDEE